MIGLLKTISLIKDALVGLWNLGLTIIDYFRRREVDKEKEKIDQAADVLKKANEITDDQERLKAKANAVCALDPSCDASKRND